MQPISRRLVAHRRSFPTTLLSRQPQYPLPLLRLYSTHTTTPPVPPTTKTYYTLFPSTLPLGPPPSGPFHIPGRTLRTEFLKLQQSTHPDLFPPAQRKTAESASAHLNKAYTTLLDPLSRAEYLLTLRGYVHPQEAEGERIDDVELIMEVIEANETLERAEKEEDLEELKRHMEEKVERSVQFLEEAFAKDWLERVKVECARLRFWRNVLDGIRGWEKGKPVVLEH